MITSKNLRSILFPLILIMVYLVFLYAFIDYKWKNGFLIRLQDVSSVNIGTKLLCDFFSGLLPVLIVLLVIAIQKTPLKKVGITLHSPILIGALFAIYLVMFFINGDFTIKGFYAAFFYLVIVAFSEEFLFRGYLFTRIDKEFGFWKAVVISGVLFGAAHAFMPAIVNNYDTKTFIITIASNLLGQGIIGSAMFAALYKKTGHYLCRF
ncbi:membrane protease YdiL (CAAX protease family) [Anaerotaenia torta]|uniref:CPBP family intramembrane glutamic endopeptidase n=1 Tax=Anaerotaenia torta TaxID=433293 RepID=UPI003D221496